jgi:lipopolysaccharide biosynthesis glycosyltransferase
MKPNVIAIATDANQFPAAAFLAGKFAALNPREDVEIVIFTEAARDIDLAREHGVQATFHELGSTTAGLPEPTKRLKSRAAYVRFLVPNLVGDSVRRVLYVDTDTYPESNALFGLFDLDMGGYTIAGVRQKRSALRHIPHNLMNSGVLLIDRAKYVATDMESRLLAKAEEIKLGDQHAINRVLMGNWLELSPAMNMLRAFRFSFVARVVPPSITHFVDAPKPWHGARFGDPHPARAELEKYLLRSPWKSFVTKTVNFHQAWDSLQAKRGGPTFAAAVTAERTEPLSDDDVERAKVYLLREFADVKQGITQIDLAALAPSAELLPRRR